MFKETRSCVKTIPNWRNLTVGIIALLTVAFMSLNVAAETTSFNFNIPSQEVSVALEVFTEQTDFSILYSIEEIGSVPTQAVKGSFSPEQALDIMLENTGLSYKKTGNKTIAIKKGSSQSSALSAPDSNTAGVKSPDVLMADNGKSDAKKQQTTDQEGKVSYDDYQFEKMIVTASKRPRKLQEVPISIYAMMGEKMNSEGIAGIEDIGDRVAGLEVINQGDGFVQLAARGVTSFRGALEATAAVGYYVDEVPISSFSMRMPEVSMWDVDRIEVLRGPQGTLFGEGSMAGTIRVITNKADSTEFSARLGGDFSSTQDGGMSYSAKAMMNIPVLSEKLGVRVVAGLTNPEGWVDYPELGMDDTNSSKQSDIRMAALFTPTDKLTIDAFVSFHEQDVDSANLATSPGEFLSTALGSDASEPDDLRSRDQNYEIYNMTVTYDFGFASLVSATSYFDSEISIYNDVTPVGTILFANMGRPVDSGVGFITGENNLKLLTQELRLVSNGDERLDWTVGVFYKENERTRAQGVDIEVWGMYINPFFSVPYMRDIVDSFETAEMSAYALFADVDFELTDTLAIGAGMRYYADERESTIIDYSPSAFFNVPASNVGVKFTQDGDETDITPKLVVNWKAGDGILIFAKIARGFRSGGTNIEVAKNPGSGLPNIYEPEELWSYETGVKTNIFPGLTMNVYGYFSQWKNMQVSQSFNNFFAYVANVGEAESYGAELELFASLPVEGWTASLSGSYTKSELVTDFMSNGVLEAAKGNQLPNAPEFKINISTEYAKSLTDSLFAIARASYTYKSEMYSEISNHESYLNDVYHQVNASIGLEKDTWGVHLYINNLFDRDNEVAKSVVLASVESVAYTSYNRPRTIGLRFDLSF